MDASVSVADVTVNCGILHVGADISLIATNSLSLSGAGSILHLEGGTITSASYTQVVGAFLRGYGTIDAESSTIFGDVVPGKVFLDSTCDQECQDGFSNSVPEVGRFEFIGGRNTFNGATLWLKALDDGSVDVLYFASPLIFSGAQTQIWTDFSSSLSGISVEPIVSPNGIIVETDTPAVNQRTEYYPWHTTCQDACYQRMLSEVPPPPPCPACDADPCGLDENGKQCPLNCDMCEWQYPTDDSRYCQCPNTATECSLCAYESPDPRFCECYPGDASCSNRKMSTQPLLRRQHHRRLHAQKSEIHHRFCILPGPPTPGETGSGTSDFCPEGSGGALSFTIGTGSSCSLAAPAGCSVECGSNGQCNSFSGTCICNDGWQGDFCDVPKCDTTCGGDVQGACEFLPGASAPECVCISPYSGSDCSQVICSPVCLNSGTCIVGGEGTAICSCTSGFEGTDCSTVVAAGSCPSCGSHGTCGGAANGYQCICDNGWDGTQCEVPRCPGYVAGVASNCNGNGQCLALNGATTPSCTCVAGWEGEDCSTPACFSDRCKNGGTCSVTNGKLQCSCPSGWAGSTCTLAVSPSATGSDGLPRNTQIAIGVGVSVAGLAIIAIVVVILVSTARKRRMWADVRGRVAAINNPHAQFGNSNSTE